MEAQHVAQTLQRLEAALTRRPGSGLHEDAPAVASWRAGTQAVTRHANGTAIESDMPTEFGGGGARITPGWLFRAGLAACSATCIAMLAAREGVELTQLECEVGSRSDARGWFGLRDGDGAPVRAGPDAMRLQVRIAAHAASAERLRALVEQARGRSPIGCAVQHATPVALHVEVIA